MMPELLDFEFTRVLIFIVIQCLKMVTIANILVVLIIIMSKPTATDGLSFFYHSLHFSFCMSALDLFFYCSKMFYMFTHILVFNLN